MDATHCAQSRFKQLALRKHVKHLVVYPDPITSTGDISELQVYFLVLLDCASNLLSPCRFVGKTICWRELTYRSAVDLALI